MRRAQSPTGSRRWTTDPLLRRARAQELDETRWRQRLAHPVSLEAVAAARVEELELLARAPALGDDLEPQAPRQPDDRLGDRRVARVGLEIGDERDVDLQRVDREVLEVRQRRVPGPEVVDRDPEALVAQLVEHAADRVEVVQQRGLGHLELEPRRLAARVADDRRDTMGEVLAVELPRGWAATSSW